MIREARPEDLPALLELYLHLHEDAVPQDSPQLAKTWQAILADENHHLLVYQDQGRPVSSCVCVVVPNLTRGVRPYALIENVVTHADFRGRGYASRCLARAVELAREAGCYKVMLLTGSKEEATLRFYERAGFNRADKTAFIRWLP